MKKPYYFLLISLLSLLSACATTGASPHGRVFNLTLLVPGPMGAPTPVGSILVRNLERYSDGSLCFVRNDSDVYGCLKVFQYDLADTQAQ